MATKKTETIAEKPEKTTTKKASALEYFYASGKRKTSVARVRLYPKGKGAITINEKPLNEYFKQVTSNGIIHSPLKLTGHSKDFDISAKVVGGGTNSQAEAVRHGISRALLIYDETLRVTLKKAGFLTRDARIKERKKPGLKRARRAPQFSKR
jgi:small subunit ribosomal protein S9